MPENEVVEAEVMQPPAVAPQPSPAEQEAAFNKLILRGDLSGLNDREKVVYYRMLCDRIEIDWMTKPFDYLLLKGKVVLYLNAGGSYQINKRWNISHNKVECAFDHGLCLFLYRAAMPDGRVQESTGAAYVDGLKGEDLANAVMKAETRAKRRSTLSLMGLGGIVLADEPEGSQKVSFDPNTVDATGVSLVSDETREKIGVGAAKLSGLGVTVEMLISRFGKPLNEFGEEELAEMRNIVVALTDKKSTVQELFGDPKPVAEQPPMKAPGAGNAGANKQTAATSQLGTERSTTSPQGTAPAHATTTSEPPKESGPAKNAGRQGTSNATAADAKKTTSGKGNGPSAAEAPKDASPPPSESAPPKDAKPSGSIPPPLSNDVF
jgi:hypothetical protein